MNLLSVDTIEKSEHTISNSRELFIKKEKKKNMSLVSVDTTEKSADTIRNNRKPFMKKEKKKEHEPSLSRYY